jgi:hypothetical protein
MSVYLFLAASAPSEAPKHIPHLLVPLLKFGHGVPAIAGLLVVVLLVSYAFFKLAHMRPV